MKSEKALQTYLKRHLEELNCLVFKFASPTCRGVPDLLAITPFGMTFYIEMKSPTGKGRLTPLQSYQIDRIRERGASVFIIDSLELANRLITLVINRKI